MEQYKYDFHCTLKWGWWLLQGIKKWEERAEKANKGGAVDDGPNFFGGNKFVVFLGEGRDLLPQKSRKNSPHPPTHCSLEMSLPEVL